MTKVSNLVTSIKSSYTQSESQFIILPSEGSRVCIHRRNISYIHFIILPCTGSRVCVHRRNVVCVVVKGIYIPRKRGHTTIAGIAQTTIVRLHA
jgi:hypothetical protein